MTKEEQKKHDETMNHYKNLFTSFGVDWDSQRWCLHHIDPNLKHQDPARYHEWRIEDVAPLTIQQHMHIHMKLQNPKGGKKSAFHVRAMVEGHKKERRACNILIHRVVVHDGVEGIEAFVFPSCAAAARHIGCTLQLVYQVASKTQHNRRAMGWSCNYVPKTVSLGKVEEEDMVKSLVA